MTHYHTNLSSSYNHDGLMYYKAKYGDATHDKNSLANPSQGSIPTISQSYSQEMITNYTSVSGSLLYTFTLFGQLTRASFSLVRCRLEILFFKT